MILLLIVLFSAFGLLISLYFTAVYYGWMEADAGWVPRVCRMDARTCARIVFTRTGRLAGIPNSVLGMAFYSTLAVTDASGVLQVFPFDDILLAACGLALIMGLYLSYWLLFVARTACPLCFASHSINLVLLVLILLKRGV